MKILGLETSCDETCASVLDGSGNVLSSVIASSLKEHARFGGVIPEIASRKHLESIVVVVDQAMRKARVSSSDLDAIGVTQGPGLIGSLLVGISFARGLGLAWNKPIIGVNHVRAHMYAPFIDRDIVFPFVGLVVSGGHTSLYEVRSLLDEVVIGSARDDAAGEAFDKVAKILGLGYPGGPMIEKAALKGNKKSFSFRCGCPGLDFSYSGIKTGVLYKVRELKKTGKRITRSCVEDISASFQDAIVSDIVAKAMRACELTKTKVLAVGGGVAFNGYLRTRLEQASQSRGIHLHIAAPAFCLDNAAMIASLAARMVNRFGKKIPKESVFFDSLMN